MNWITHSQSKARRIIDQGLARGILMLTMLALMLGLAGVTPAPVVVAQSGGTQLRIRVVSAASGNPVIANYQFLINEDNTGNAAQTGDCPGRPGRPRRPRRHPTSRPVGLHCPRVARLAKVGAGASRLFPPTSLPSTDPAAALCQGPPRPQASPVYFVLHTASTQPFGFAHSTCGDVARVGSSSLRETRLPQALCAARRTEVSVY